MLQAIRRYLRCNRFLLLRNLRYLWTNEQAEQLLPFYATAGIFTRYTLQFLHRIRSGIRDIHLA